jgi:hypothetical protein
MPDDSSQGFKDAQRKHADEIRTARVISQKTGLPFNQVRARLKEFAEKGQAQQAENVRNGRPSDPVPAVVQYGPKGAMGFDPRPFAGSEFTGKKGGGSGEALPQVGDFTVVLNGTGYEDCIFNMQLGTAI